MTFLSPLWWWALAGLALPVAIHLLSRGRRLRIHLGSVRHLSGAESRALSQVRLSGWPQLLLRMLLLAVLALALTGPRWPADAPASSTGWVLVDPELAASLGDLGAQGDEIRSALTEARADSGSIRLLMPGLPELDEVVPPARNLDAWSLLREADAIAPVGAPFSVYTFDRVAMLRGRRPRLARRVDWEVVADPRISRWIDGARVTSEGDHQVTVGTSTPAGTRFDRYVWSREEPPSSGSALRWDPNSNSVELTSRDPWSRDNRLQVALEVEPLSVRLAAATDREDDAWHIQRAMTAVGRFLDRPIAWSDSSGERVDLSIALGESSTSPTAGAAALYDSGEPFESCRGSAYAESVPGNPRLSLSRCPAESAADAGVGWWLDGWGRPFLQRGPEPGSYRLRGRFDPRWSSLATSPALPRLLLGLVTENEDSRGGAEMASSDRRTTTGEERLPGMSDGSTMPRRGERDLPQGLAWLIVALLLALERWVSWRAA